MIGYVVTRASEVPSSDEFLSVGEREVLARLGVPKRRAEFRHGRWTAKRALDLAWQRRARGPAPCWSVLAAGDGAPEAHLGDGAPADFRISLSHSAGLAMAAVADMDAPELGCDVELVEPRSDELVRQFFTQEERARLLAVDESERALFACLIWSAKESALKALRTGLRADTRSVSVSFVPARGESWSPLEVRLVASGRTLFGHWRRRDAWVKSVVGTQPESSPFDLAARPG